MTYGEFIFSLTMHSKEIRVQVLPGGVDTAVFADVPHREAHDTRRISIVVRRQHPGVDYDQYFDRFTQAFDFLKAWQVADWQPISIDDINKYKIE